MVFPIHETTLNKMEILYARLVREGCDKEARVLVRCIAEILGDWCEYTDVQVELSEFESQVPTNG